MSFPAPFYKWRPHPWHGLEVGPDPPRVVQAFIEITPFDVIKYELDKVTGFLRVDRPQRSSSQPPCLYGLIPRTYCGERVRALNPEASRGDGEADDKIIAVLANDDLWTEVADVADLPKVLVERMRHYFTTYKLVPGGSSPTAIGEAYGVERALAVVEAAMADYLDEYGG